MVDQGAVEAFCHFVALGVVMLLSSFLSRNADKVPAPLYPPIGDLGVVDVQGHSEVWKPLVDKLRHHCQYCLVITLEGQA